jgi:hypothetical protein
LPGLRVTATAKLTGKTGVEMEALTAASVACLTIYDMAKAADRWRSAGGCSRNRRHPALPPSENDPAAKAPSLQGETGRPLLWTGMRFGGKMRLSREQI